MTAPLHDLNRLAQSLQDDGPESGAGGPQRLRLDGRVMMIDDEPIMIELVQTFLEEEGYRDFTGLDDPRQGMARLRALKPDILLLDLLMPEVSGFDILDQIRSDPALAMLPVIVMTSANDAATKLKVLELGATDFLEKPVDPSELTLRLRNTLAFKAYRDRLAYFDPLTNLPNRKRFLETLADGVAGARRSGATCAMLHIDLDRFKQVNETLGHRVGDILLKQATQRLQISTRPTGSIARTGQSGEWTLARIGGDEFGALLPDLARIDDAVTIARRVMAVMSRPFNVEGQELYVGASVGIAAFPHDGDQPETVFKYAEAALNNAKQRGRNTYSFYSSSLNARAVERLTLENQLRRALARDELRLHYQPKLEVATGRIIGAEALVRWQHPELGMMSPLRFIPIAEETGLILDIGAWVVQEACRTCAAWVDEGLDLKVSVNAAATQFRDGRLLRDVTSALDASGLPTHRLMVELTESILMHNQRDGLETMTALRDLGVGLSLDDFGTGYSSLAYLKRLQLNELKIDRSFVTGLPMDGDGAAIVGAVIAMAHHFGLTVTAEGVECQPHLAFLREHGCDEFQGFLVSQPLPGDEFRAFVRAWDPARLGADDAAPTAAMLTTNLLGATDDIDDGGLDPVTLSSEAR